MKWKLFLLTATLLVVSSGTAAEKNGNEVGSGNSAFDTDDEDLLIAHEGSAVDDDDDNDIDEVSGSGLKDKDVTTLLQPTRLLTACEQLKQSTKDISGFSRASYVPKCTDTGEFERLQCHGPLSEEKCWCVGPEGTEIAGTLMSKPETPDCISGANLKSCSFKYLKSNYRMLGSYRPRCTHNGDYEPIQCYEGECWCVDKNGIEKPNTRARGNRPVCEDQTEAAETIPVDVTPDNVITSKKPKVPVTKPEYDIDPTDNGVVNIDDGFTPSPEEETEKPKPPPHTVDVEIDDTLTPEDEDDKLNHPNEESPAEETYMKRVINKPFILGAIIAGAVVGLLGAILLVMFIVYRMRKKDEGSYALEEQKFTNYSYMKAPDKEFYA